MSSHFVSLTESHFLQTVSNGERERYSDERKQRRLVPRMTFRRATFTCLMTSFLGKGDLYKEISVSGAVSTVPKQ